MPQFRLEKEILPEDHSFSLSGAEAFHATTVLRYRVGDPILCFDREGRRIEGRIDQINEKGEISGHIVSRFPIKTPRVAIRLYQALLKGQAWEEVLVKGTEVGVSAFIPVLSSRTAVVFKEEDAERKIFRWQQLILAAVKQSERCSTPSVSRPVQFLEALNQNSNADVSLFAWEKLDAIEKDNGQLAKALRQKRLDRTKALTVNIWIGPEGGFSDQEAEGFIKKGVIPFSLGNTLLRAETAALAACLLIRYEMGELG